MFKITGFVSLVALLFWVGYSLLGGSPLLILKHDTPDDGRLVRGFFHVHYTILCMIAAAGALSFMLGGDTFLAKALVGLAAIGFAALLLLVRRMDRLRGIMSATDTNAIGQFRRLHVSALALNFTNLLTLFWIISQSTLITCTQTPPGCTLDGNGNGQGSGCIHRCSLFG